MEKLACEVFRLGVVPYQQAWEMQEQFASQVAAGICPPALFLLEHPHTYTFGRKGKAENLLWDAGELSRRGVQVLWVDRGGDVTYHGPGQLVGYPILPLKPRLSPASPSVAVPGVGQGNPLGIDYVGYLRRLEQVLILALERLCVAASRVKGLTGVWVKRELLRQGLEKQAGRVLPAKIASIGVKVDARGVSRHGFALNVNPDMSFWEGIIGCGLEGYSQTCLADILQPLPSMELVMDRVETVFGEVFGFQMVDIERGGRSSDA